MIDFNATQAYIRAGYSPNGAAQSAERLLRNAEIQAEIQRAIDKMIERTGITVDYVVNGLRRVAERCLAEETSAAGVTRVIELLGRYLGLFEKDNKLGNPKVVLQVERIDKPTDAGENLSVAGTI